MKVFWEKIGVLGHIYRLVGRGWSDEDIAIKLKLTRQQVQSCVGWLLRFLQLATRLDLILNATCSGRLVSIGAAAQFSSIYDSDLAKRQSPARLHAQAFKRE